MSDISKCKNVMCSLSETCERFTAPSGIYQSFSDFYVGARQQVSLNKNRLYKYGCCDYYWSNASNYYKWEKYTKKRGKLI